MVENIRKQLKTDENCNFFGNNWKSLKTAENSWKQYKAVEKRLKMAKPQFPERLADGRRPYTFFFMLWQNTQHNTEHGNYNLMIE